MINYYIIDTETTGLSTKMHEVIEVSIVRCSDRMQLTEFIKPDYPERCSYDALRIQNKTAADLQKGNSREYAVSRINKFLEEDNSSPAARCFIAHNAAFDMKFMHSLYEKVNQSLPVNLWICTVSLTKQYIKQNNITINGKKPKTNLHAACDLLQIKKLSQAHSSKVDSRNTYLLFNNLINDKKIDHLPLIKTAVHTLAQDEELDFDFNNDVE